MVQIQSLVQELRCHKLQGKKWTNKTGICFSSRIPLKTFLFVFVNCCFTLICRWNFFLFILLGICWASVVWCLFHLFSSSLSIFSTLHFHFLLLLELWLWDSLPLSFFTFCSPFLFSSHCLSVQHPGLSLLDSVSFQPVSNLFIELFIGNFVPIILLHPKVLFGSPSNMIGNSLYSLIHCLCFQVYFVSLHMIIIVSTFIQ